MLRLLLCVSLVANGIGLAQASMRMELAHAAHAAEQPVLVVASSVCHGDATAGVSNDVAIAHAAMGHGDSAELAGADALMDGPECCDGTGCQCACPQQASATTAAALVLGSLPALPALGEAGRSQRATPRLPHLIRPPIG